MSEWWSYRLSDFLMFSPRVYFRLIERYNQEFWPLHIAFLIAGLAAIAFAARPGSRFRRGVLPILAIAWLFCGWQFLWLRYATINWAASYAALGFLLQAGLLLLSGLRKDESAAAPTFRIVGAGIALFGLLAYPLLVLSFNRSLAAAEIFGMMPDPTAIATLGTVLALKGARSWLLMPIPILWCTFSGLTLWTMWDEGASLPLL
ncbi:MULTISPECIES: DUF6064 family protein [unclassified Sinorhizobium]|uniref:DUF6064 family protein n=1 Tax=unclassified Sinorhizobium TaxID=2613772 RepID=UPI003524D98E